MSENKKIIVVDSLMSIKEAVNKPEPIDEKEMNRRLVLTSVETIAGAYAADIVRSLYEDKLTVLTADEIGPFATKHNYNEDHVFLVLELLVGARLWLRVVLKGANKERITMSRLLRRLAAAKTVKEWKETASSAQLGWSAAE